MSAELGRAITIRIPQWLSTETITTALGAVGGSFITGALTQTAANALKATGWSRVGVSFLVGGLMSALGYIGMQKTSGLLRYASFGAFVGGLAFPFTMLVMQALKTTPEQVGTKLYATLAGIAGRPVVQEVTPTYTPAPEVTVTTVPAEVAEVTVSPEEFVSPEVTAGVTGALKSTIE